MERMPTFEPRPLWISLAVIGFLALLSGGYLAFLSAAGVPESGNKTTQDSVTVLQGKYICLPREDGVKEKECTPGLEVGADLYALDLAKVIESGASTGIVNGSNIIVGGIIVPMDEISSDQWKKYYLKGIIAVEEIAKQ